MRLKLISKVWEIVLLSSILLAPVCRADHLPSELQARGKPEKRLAGIHLERSKLADVIKMYGKPTKIEKQPSPPDFDMYDYYWNKPKAKLHLVVERGFGIGEHISLIEVEGSLDSGTIGRTGAGLRLGDNLADLRRIYGRRFKVRNIPELKTHGVMVQWRSEEYSLVVDLDRRGRIKKLLLLPPE